jgi:GA module
VSKPKPTVGSVKRRGLAIATAVAVAGSGIVSANYVSAQETSDEVQETNNSLDGAKASEGGGEKSQTDESEALQGQADDEAVSVNPQEQTEGVEGTGPVEDQSEDAASPQAPTVESVFNQNKDAIRTQLQTTKNPDVVASEFAKRYQSNFDNEGFNAFEHKFTHEVKYYFNSLVASGVITFEETGYSLPTAEQYFGQLESGIAAELRKSGGKPGMLIDEVVENHVKKLDSTHNFGTEEAKAKWKAQFRELVDKKEKSLFPEYYTPEAEDYFKSRKTSIVADFRSPNGQNAQAYLEKAFAEAEKAGIMPVDEEQKAEWKEEFRTLVQTEEDAVVALQKAEAYAQLGTITDKNPAQAEIFKKQIDESVDPNELAKILAATKAEKENPVAPFATTNDQEQEPPVEDAPEAEVDKPSTPAESVSPFVAKIVENAKNKALATIEDADHLNAGQKAAFKGAIAAASSLRQVEGLLDGALATASLQEDEHLRDSHLSDVKEAAIEALDGAEHLSEAQKTAYKGAIDAATSPEQVELLMDGALEANDLQAGPVTNVKDAALVELNQKPLNPVIRGIFKQQLEDANTIDEINRIMELVDSAVDAHSLREQKRAAIEALGGFEDLTDSQRADFEKRILEAETEDDFAGVVDALVDADDAARGEREAAEHRGVIESVLEANANSVEDPNKAALTAEDLAFPFAQHRDEVAEDLIEAKRAGVAAVDGAQHLSDEQKTAYKAAVEAAASDSQIDELVYAALDANDLEAGYAKIFEQLGLTENPGFSPNEKKWTSEDFANSFKQHAANEQAMDLQEVRDAGSAAVDGIYYLTENQKSAFKKQIAAAGSEDAVSEIVFAALDLADKQGAQEAGQDTVAAEKSRVLKAIEGFSNLTDQQKADFEKKVDEANTVAYLRVLGETAAQLNAKQAEQAGSTEQKPSDVTISEETDDTAKPSSEFGFSNVAKGLFGVTAILGVIGVVFGGVAHAIKHFPGFEHVHNQVRETLAKFGIRF